MLFTVKQDLDLCVEFKVTPRQLMFIKMLVRDPKLDSGEWNKQSYMMTNKFKQELGGMTPTELADLLAREIIIDYNSLGQTFYDSYEINPKWAAKFELKVFPLVNALFDAYPYFLYMEGKRYVAKSISPAEIAEEYLLAINNDVREHERVLDDVKWAMKNNALATGLKKFVGSKYWLAIRELRSTGTQNITSNVIIL
jgi:hypothetical protein